MDSWVRYSVAVYLGLLMAGSIMASSMSEGGNGSRRNLDAPRPIQSSPPADVEASPDPTRQRPPARQIGV